MVINFFPENKRGWVKVLEVFVSIMLVMGVIVFLLNKGYAPDRISDDVSEMEISILRSIQLNDSLRSAVIDAEVPSNWSDFNAGSLTGIRDKISYEKLPSMECEAKICSLGDVCTNDSDLEKDIYSESAVISSDKTSYSPRQIKLFCWEK